MIEIGIYRLVYTRMNPLIQAFGSTELAEGSPKSNFLFIGFPIMFFRQIARFWR